MTNNPLTPVLIILGITNLATVKVPEGVTPLTFYSVSVIAGITLGSLFVLLIKGFTHNRRRVRDWTFYGVGFSGVIGLLTLAVSMIPSPV